MKKLVVYILLVVMTICCGSAYADARDGIFYGIDMYEAKEIIDEWAEIKGLDDWIIMNDVNGVLYGLGGICLEDYKNDSNNDDWSIDGFEKWSIEKFEMSEIHTIVVDEVDGIKFYHSRAKSETTPLGYKNGEAFYNADVVFMVYSTNE